MPTQLLRCSSLAFASLLVCSPFAFSQVGAERAHHAAVRGEEDTADRATRLPVTRVLLYKNGVGYFEHAGEVHGNQQVVIDFTSAQLNDVLQSLTAVDLNGGRIAGAGYSSTTPLEQQLQNLSLGLGANTTTDDFYQAIRGVRLEVRNGAYAATGRLLNVEERQDKAINDSETVAEKRYLTIISDAGVAQTLELNSRTQVRILDADVHQDATRYLELLANTRSHGLRHLTLQADGTGTRQVRVSYIGEVPVWKATYRILFGERKPGDAAAPTATMQGWAVIDNTTGSDWTNVQLSLIAGAPQSFVQPISQPYYARRPVIGLPQEAQLTPQTHESGDGTQAGIAGMEGIDAGASGGIIGGMLGGVGKGGGIGGGRGFAAQKDMQASQSVSVGGPVPMVMAAAPMIGYEDSAAASIIPDTRTSSFDDYFEYSLSLPITIRKNESALVPILQSKVEAQRVTLWSPSQPAALRALWLKNTSTLTLDRGSFSIIDDGKFGGEGLLDPIHPGEKRLLSYAADQAVRVTTDYQHDTHRLQQVAVSKGILTMKTLEIAEQEYLVHNAAADTRDVIVEQPKRQGWTLDSEVKPVETTSSAYRFNVVTAANETVRLHIGERHTIAERYEIADLGQDQLDLMLRSNGDAPRLRQQLAPIFEAKRRLADIDAQLNAKIKATEDIGKDQQRLRENLAALKTSNEERALVRRYTGELNQQEDTMNALRKDEDSLRAQRTAAVADLSEKIQSLQMDESVS